MLTSVWSDIAVIVRMSAKKGEVAFFARESVAGKLSGGL